MTKIQLQIDRGNRCPPEIIKFPEKSCEGFFVIHPNGLILINNKMTARWANELLEKEAEKFGISKTEILERPDHCYDLDQYKEIEVDKMREPFK